MCETRLVGETQTEHRQQGKKEMQDIIKPDGTPFEHWVRKTGFVPVEGMIFEVITTSCHLYEVGQKLYVIKNPHSSHKNTLILSTTKNGIGDFNGFNATCKLIHNPEKSETQLSLDFD